MHNKEETWSWRLLIFFVILSHQCFLQRSKFLLLQTSWGRYLPVRHGLVWVLASQWWVFFYYFWQFTCIFIIQHPLSRLGCRGEAQSETMKEAQVEQLAWGSAKSSAIFTCAVLSVQVHHTCNLTMHYYKDESIIIIDSYL